MIKEMNKELDYFRIEGSYGGSQDWFVEPMMHLGGCAAAVACDTCIYSDLYLGTEGLYPFDINRLSQKDYIRFSDIMKPYLHPRMTGIDRTEIYIDGFERYLKDIGAESCIKAASFEGDEPVGRAKTALKAQIDKGLPLPCLTLYHKSASMKDYVWHWYMLTGYEIYGDMFMVKAVTYGSFRWLDFDTLWNTGYKRRGGLIIYDLNL